MNAIRTFALFATLSAGALAVQAAPVSPEGDHSNWPAYATGSSTLTRADVVAQYQNARQAGQLPLNGDRVVAQEAQGASTLTRAAVQQEAAVALHAGLITLGDR